MARNCAQVRITNEALTELLGLPEGQRVALVLPPEAADLLCGTIQIVIEGDDFPEIPEGVAPYPARLTFTRSEGGPIESKVEL